MKKYLCVLPFLLMSEVCQAQVTNCASATPVLSASPDYSTGDSMGGELTLSGLLNPLTGAGVVTSLMVTDKASQAIDIDVVLMKSSMSSTTYTDNSAFTPATADMSKILAEVALGSSSRFAFASNSIHYLGSLAIPVATNPASSTLYAHIVARGSFNAASTSDLTLTVCVMSD